MESKENVEKEFLQLSKEALIAFANSKLNVKLLDAYLQLAFLYGRKYQSLKNK